MIGLIGAILIGCAVGWAAERFGYTRLGLLPAGAMAVGGAVLAYMVLIMFGIGIWGRGVTSFLGAVIALLVLPGRLRR